MICFLVISQSSCDETRNGNDMGSKVLPILAVSSEGVKTLAAYLTLFMQEPWSRRCRAVFHQAPSYNSEKHEESVERGV